MRARILLTTFLVVLILSLALFTLQAHAQEELKCDIDEDGEVGPKDLEIVVNSYGSTPSQPSWNAKCDFNNDNKIDALDLYQIGKDWGKTRQGTGILYAYITDYSDQVEQNAAGNYLVFPGGTYNFEINNITEYAVHTTISVWARYRVGNATYNVEIRSFNLPPTLIIRFHWTVPSDLPITTSIKFKYGTDYQGPSGAWVYARKDISPSPRLLLVVPETFLGSIGAIAALFGGFTIRNIRRKRK
jgi:hypothetical protein